MSAPAHGSVEMHRTMTPVPPASRRHCRCGCRKRATHTGKGGGVALITGCELLIRRWVKQGPAFRFPRRPP